MATKRKGHHFHSSKKRPKLEIVAGMKGFIVTCSQQHEVNAQQEALNLVEEYYENDSQACEASLEEELQALRENKEDSEKFSCCKTEVKGVVFIKCPENAQPVEIVSKIFHDYKEYGTRKARFISRIIPIQAICSPRVDSVVSSMRPLIQDHFPQSTQKYAIVIKRRLRDDFSRDECISQIASLVPSQHRVDLKNPDLVLLIEVFKNVAGVSIVKDFYKFHKFSFIEAGQPQVAIKTKVEEKEKQLIEEEEKSEEKEVN